MKSTKIRKIEKNFVLTMKIMLNLRLKNFIELYTNQTLAYNLILYNALIKFLIKIVHESMLDDV